MPSSTSPYTTEPPVNPLEPLADLLGWLASTTAHVAIGLLVGALAAHLMRRRHLRWTWAGAFLVPLLLVQSKLSGWALRHATQPPSVPRCVDAGGIAKTCSPAETWPR